MATTGNNTKLKKALSRRRQLETELAQAHDLLAQLLSEEKAPEDLEFTQAKARLAEKRAKLHRLRMNIGRKRFSCRCREEQIKRIEREIVECKQTEATMLAAIDQAEAELQAIQERIGREAVAELAGTTRDHGGYGHEHRESPRSSGCQRGTISGGEASKGS